MRPRRERRGERTGAQEDNLSITQLQLGHGLATTGLQMTLGPPTPSEQRFRNSAIAPISQTISLYRDPLVPPLASGMAEHAAAEVAYQHMVAQRRPEVTTTFIFLECANAAARRTFRSDFCALRRTLDLRDELIVPTNADWQHAWAAYEGDEAGQAGIVDRLIS